jgi:hypothetical protein
MKLMVDPNFPSHRKVRKFAVALKIDHYKGMGHLIALWCEVLKQAETGELVGWDEIDLSVAAGWSGNPKELATALREIGLLERRGSKYLVHDWLEHQGDIVEKRKQWKERQRRARGSRVCHDGVTRDGSVSHAYVHESLPILPLPIPPPQEEEEEKSVADATPPSPTSGANGQDPGADHRPTPDVTESQEIDRTVAVYAAWAHPPIGKKIIAIQELLDLGCSHEYIRSGAQVNKPADSGFWHVVKALKAGRERVRLSNATVPTSEPDANGDSGRVNGNPTGHIPQVLKERREVVHARHDKALARVQKLLADLSEAQKSKILEQIRADAIAANIPPGPIQESWIQSRLMSSLAKQHGIEGL